MYHNRNVYLLLIDLVQVLLGLSDSELDTGMGVTNVLHRRKLRLAIDQNKVPSDW